MKHEDYITYPTWKKMIVLSETVSKLKIKHKRSIFHTVRNLPIASHDTFFPTLGVTAGCFCTWQILNDTKRNTAEVGERDDQAVVGAGAL